MPTSHQTLHGKKDQARQLRGELARRKEAGEQHIWIRHGKIVPIPEEKRHQQQSQHGQPKALPRPERSNNENPELNKKASGTAHECKTMDQHHSAADASTGEKVVQDQPPMVGFHSGEEAGSRVTDAHSIPKHHTSQQAEHPAGSG